MTVGDACVRSVTTARPDESVADAAHRMLRRAVGTLVIVDPRSPDDRAIGIVTDRDIVTRGVAADLNLDETTLSMVMSVPVQSIREDRPLEEAVERMSRRSIRRLAVTDEAGRLTGILALDDVLESFVQEVDAIGRLLGKHAPIHG